MKERMEIDDSAAAFSTWSPAELHDAMETHFSQFRGSWPNWQMWGLLAGTFDSASVGGIMFDAAAAYGGAGEARIDRASRSSATTPGSRT